jgi:hypothetical protein
VFKNVFEQFLKMSIIPSSDGRTGSGAGVEDLRSGAIGRCHPDPTFDRFVSKTNRNQGAHR